MSRRITLEDVARHAGVGPVTVSYVLNGRSRLYRISEETQKRVLSAANELQYRPNAVARMLATSQTNILAVVFQSGGHFTAWSGFTSEVMRGIAEATIEEGCDLLLHTKQVRDAADEASALSDGRVDGALILRDEHDPTLKHLIERGFPCVQFFTHSVEETVPWVDCDNVMGGSLATEHLIALGHRRIGMVYGSEGSVSSRDRVAGFRRTMKTHAIPVREDWVVSHGDPGAYPRSVLDLFREGERPTSLFVWSDDVALQIMAALREEQIRVPEDVSIVGFDSSAGAESAVPPLTSVRQPIREMARTATHILVSLVRKREIAQRQLLVKPTLDVRASTSPLSL